MLRQRILSALILLPIVIALTYLGGWAFNAMVLLVVGLAAWEYGRIFHDGGYAPSAPLIIGGSLLLVLFRALFQFQYSDALITALVLLAMTWHLISYERGAEKSASDFAITLSGIFYIGWLGAYFISLRMLEYGFWWFLLALPAVWMADAGAYAIGRHFGRRKIAPRVSPKKSWEGYLAGIITGVLGTGLLALLWQNSNPDTTLARGLLLGLVLSVITTLGDLGESMIKRQFGVKDSSRLIPGHGGLLDRIDSWLWAAVISYYMITWLW